MKVALDTNVLAYAEGTNGYLMRDRALRLIEELPSEWIVLPAQALGELFSVLVKKAKLRPTKARASVLSWRDAYQTIETSSAIVVSALDLACDHQVTIWDAIILSSAADAGCRLLLSEDLQEGFTWRGVTVTSPFATSLHPLLGGILDEPGR